MPNTPPNNMFEMLFLKDHRINKDQFIHMISKSEQFKKNMLKFERSIQKAVSRFEALKAELQEELWLDYETLADLCSSFASAVIERYRLDFPSPILMMNDLLLNYLPIQRQLFDFHHICADRSHNRYISFPEAELESYGTNLTIAISNSDVLGSQTLISQVTNINKYSYGFGNNPLLLAVAKGWTHYHHTYYFNPREPLTITGQRKIIEGLFSRQDLDVNKQHLFNGMTALHIACLRGDDPLLIQKLLARGADVELIDYEGKIAMDYLDVDYSNAKQIFLCLHPDNSETSDVYTLPGEQERINHIEQIRAVFTEFIESEYADNSIGISLC